jgi:2-oxoisovalerate dehydrogenase E1 component
MSHPFAPVLERAMLVNAEAVVAASLQVIAGTAPVPRRFGSGLAKRSEVTAPASAERTSPPAPVGSVSSTAPAVGNPDTSAPPSMAGEPLMMPFGDLTVSEGRLIRWVKQVGEAVTEGELVVEIETDKAVVEVEAPCNGTMAQHLEAEGNMVKMGQQIAVITPSGA